tara:strand:+ start:70 stop:492 length:423 start_codon:yes stop_codon:yes gene_type:complete
MADINWDPPATLYIYNAALYCQPCGKALVEQFNGALDKDTRNVLGWSNHPDLYEDSNTWPQEYSRHDGETDSPDHCETCHRFLGRRLTDDGVEYVRQSAVDDLDQHGAIGDVVQGWLDYYGVDGICLASAVGIECETEGE